MTIVITAVLSVFLVAALLWLLFLHRGVKADPAVAALEIKKLLPVHCKHFPQIHSVLRAEDGEFIRRRAPRHLANRWRRDRREILRLYIQGLAEDFRGLEQLARLIALLSPDIQRKQEWEWLWLGLQFRLLYRITLLRFGLRRLPPGQLVRLTELLASLSLALESSIERLTEALPRAQTNPST
jgi:hypothetical protein